jgi:hypothetical protein
MAMSPSLRKHGWRRAPVGGGASPVAAARWFQPRRCAVALLLVVFLIPGGTAWADDDFFTSSPGPLSTSHAGQDGPDSCNQCHDGGREVSRNKCLDCHDHSDMKARINSGKGFHASSLVRGKACESCHLEHKGKGYDIMGWRTVKGGQTGFDHELAGWALKGKHAAIDCAACHKNQNRQGLKLYLGEDRLCGSCHKDDQPHKFERRDMMECARCHGESVWKPGRSSPDFDHDNRQDALMPLVGSHEDVSCGKCHPRSVFNLPQDKPDFCGNCHKSPHDGHLFGKKDCQWCHSPAYGSNDTFKFDHDAKTKFDLGTSHSKLDCYGCHSKKMGEKKPGGACEASGCHADDNKHGERFAQFGSPPACAVCHPSSIWKPTAFQHGARTGFELKARHAEVACRSCHRGKGPADFEKLPPRNKCMSCHQHKNAHKGEYRDSKCLACHVQPGDIHVDRKRSAAENHGPLSEFPLIKGHKNLTCEQCHTDKQKGLTTFELTPAECAARCHEDSLHKGTLGDECSRCHVPGDFRATRFEHNKDTEFPLKGMHLKVPTCDSCHPKRQFDGTPKECSAQGCHAKDDAHKGRLGDKCEKCHAETGDNFFNHNTMSRYPLVGKHLNVRCADCHPSITFKPRPSSCFGCHPEPEVHLGQYGTVCETCHTPFGFEDIRPLHDVGDFSLRGSHDDLSCSRCHRDNRPLAGAGNLCINCHKQDDIHSNSLSPRCGECHTQWSFAPAQFDHMRVGCALTGLHRTLPCFDCHKNGQFGALSAACASCHRQDALRVRVDALHAGYTSCSNCHNSNSWRAVGGGTGIGLGRESICR